MRRFGFGRATKLVAVMALVGAPTFALLSQAPAGASASVGSESAFRSAFLTGTGTITLTADITLTCTGPDEALRTSNEPIVIDGGASGHTITQTCGGNRVLDNDASGQLTLTNVTITHGTPDGNGGGVWSSGNVVLIGSTITDNQANDGSDGGGVYASKSDLTCTNSTISNNTATDSRGGYYAGNASFDGCTVSGNTADGEGGGGESNGNLTITNSKFTNNTSQNDEGGGFEADGNNAITVAITGSTISGNHAKDGDGGGGNVDPSGNATVNVSNSTFSGNDATDDGGGLDVQPGEGTGTTTVTGSTFSANTATNEGGGIALEDTGARLTLVNSTLTGNSGSNGGAIYAGREGNTVNLAYDTIDSNTATGATEGVASAKTNSDGRSADAPNASAEPTLAGNVNNDGPLTSFATDITHPIGGVNCATSSASSLGYNYSDDTSCTFTRSTDSESTGNDPKLGALADNTGPTETMLPANDSPLIDKVATADCGGGNDLAGFAVTTDQRGVTRPQLKGCDTGAVEVRGASVAVTKLVTGTNNATVPASSGYSFAVSCSDGSKATLTVADATKGGTSGTLANVFPGSTCSVTEAPVAYDNARVLLQPTVTYDPTTGPKLTEGQAEVVTVTNDYSLVDLLGLVAIQPKFTG
jgi:parallel beta-helix repeat protein